MPASPLVTSCSRDILLHKNSNISFPLQKKKGTKKLQVNIIITIIYVIVIYIYIYGQQQGSSELVPQQIYTAFITSVMIFKSWHSSHDICTEPRYNRVLVCVMMPIHYDGSM